MTWKKNHGRQLTAASEAELGAIPHVAISAPSFGSWAMAKIGNFISATQ